MTQNKLIEYKPFAFINISNGRSWNNEILFTVLKFTL